MNTGTGITGAMPYLMSLPDISSVRGSTCHLWLKTLQTPNIWAGLATFSHTGISVSACQGIYNNTRTCSCFYSFGIFQLWIWKLIVLSLNDDPACLMQDHATLNVPSTPDEYAFNSA
jgi:hypothetical protein